MAMTNPKGRVNYEPNSWGDGDGADEDKSTLAQKDIRFARTVQRLQRSVVSELEKIAVKF